MLALSWRAWSAKLTPRVSKTDWAGASGKRLLIVWRNGNRVARQDAASPKRKSRHEAGSYRKPVSSGAASTNDSQPGERETYQRQ